MLCYLESKLKRKREGKPNYFVCTWVGVQGDADAKKTGKDDKGRKVINLAAAKARSITLTKCIFPVDVDAVDDWDKALDPLNLLKEDEDTGEIVVKKVNESPDECTWLNLCYKQIPLSDISEDVTKIQFTSKAGKIIKQNFITVIGFCDENGIWAEELSANETAKNNLITNLANDVYTDISNEKDEKEDLFNILLFRNFNNPKHDLKRLKIFKSNKN